MPRKSKEPLVSIVATKRIREIGMEVKVATPQSPKPSLSRGMEDYPTIAMDAGRGYTHSQYMDMVYPNRMRKVKVTNRVG